jgi:hypothetical protein
MNLKKHYTKFSELATMETEICNHLTVARQDNQINGVDQYTVHMCYWYAPLRRHYLAAGDLRHCTSEYFRELSNYGNYTKVKLECHHIGFVLGGGN